MFARNILNFRRICIISNRKLHDSSLQAYVETVEAKNDLLSFAKKGQTLVSLRNLMETGNGHHLASFEKYVPVKDSNANDNERIMMQVACFLHRELAVRSAHRATKLEEVELFKQSPHIKHVCNMYKLSFAKLRRLPVPSNLENEKIFARELESIYERHSATLINMAKGANEVRDAIKELQKVESKFKFDNYKSDIQKRLDEFYFSRIGIRLLIAQYLALREPPIPNTIGLISLNTNIHDIALNAIENASYICTRTHGDAPEVTILGRLDLTFPYIPSHIEYILVELLKNSMRATVEKHGVDDMPNIKIIIADGEENEDIVVKVSDEGGGIKRSDMDKIWSYLYTTGDPSVLESMLDVDRDEMSSGLNVNDFSISAPLAGLGYGLPIARNYARFFGGDLNIMSMEGYGTDSFIYLPRLKKLVKDTKQV